MDLHELRVAARLIDGLAKRALFAEKQMVALEGQCAEWKRIADELKAERNALRSTTIDTAAGHLLDAFGSLANEPRHGATDDEYRDRIVTKIHTIKLERDALRADVNDLRTLCDQWKQRETELLAEIERLKKPARKHPVAVGEYVQRLTGFNTTPAGEIGIVTRVDNDAFEIEYEVTRPNGQRGVWCAKNCTPCDPPTASHITPEGKQTAEGAVEPKPGDVVRLVRTPTEDDLPSAVIKYRGLMGYPSAEGETGKVASFKAHVTVDMGDMIPVRGMDGYARWWPLSCIEVVKGGE